MSSLCQIKPTAICQMKNKFPALKMPVIAVVAIVVSLFFTSQAHTQTLAGTGGYTGTPGFDRGFQATTYGGNNPESWVRGSAFLDKQTGLLTMNINLETDATHAGPKGQILVYIFDAYGNLITTVCSAEVGRGGKAPGEAEQSNFQATAYLGPQVGNRAAKITVVANVTGSSFQLWGISLQGIKDAWNNVQDFLIFFF